jgi:iron complex outermembrane receptor protein
MQVFRPFVLGVALAVALASPALAQQPTPPSSPDGQAPAQQTQTPPPPPPPPPPTTQQPAKPQTPPPPTPPDKKLTYEETVVVSASKTEQQLVNAAATMTVIGAAALAVAPSANYGDVLRSVPGVNVSQISARDINITTRASTSSLATSQLSVLDGRSLYQDFFGFTMWDFMPANLDEIKRIEVIRGPASAVWGANALNGVVNVITKSPREMQGTTFTMGFGDFRRDVLGKATPDGQLYYVNGTYAQAANDRWAYKISAGGYTSDALPRPTGVIPGSPTSTSYPAFTNVGTTQPKIDVRADYDAPNKAYTMSISGGTSGTSGIMHSGIGPFTIDSGTLMSYGKFSFTKQALHVQAFGNFLNGDATNLLAVDATGSPILFSFHTKTFDTEIGDTITLGDHNAFTFGGNMRLNKFHLTIAPGETSRTEGGAYAQDEIMLNDHFRIVAGARADKFSSIGSAVFSPRVAFLIKPDNNNTFRISYNRAFRAPSMVNDNLNVTLANPLPLALLNPALAPQVFLVPTAATGNPALTEEHLDAFEVGYTGLVSKRTMVSAAWYYNKTSNEILFTETAEWPLTTPPPGWAFGPAAWGAVQSSAHFPQTFTYKNLGTERNHGVEFGIDTSLTHGAAVYVNYSYQALPKTNFDISETNLPARHRLNAGVSLNNADWLASFSLSSVTSAFWQDVLDARYHGTTQPYQMVNGMLGKKFGGHYTVTLKATNILNQEIHQHVFGDVIKRQVIGELHVSLGK